MEKNVEHQHDKHVTSYGIYFLVWFALLILTGLTVTVAGINFGKLTVTTALVIASIKSYLVLTIFMHLRLEQKAFRVFIGIALFFIIISFVLLFADYSFYVR
jgi:cytochrome c oxidase subunit IV